MVLKSSVQPSQGCKFGTHRGKTEREREGERSRKEAGEREQYQYTVQSLIVETEEGLRGEGEATEIIGLVKPNA